MELDHIFICTTPGAPAADNLTALGLSEGTGNRHLGQGTANRRFFFANFMLELLWIANAEEATSERTRAMTLYERCQLADDSVSPFGLGFRPCPGGKISRLPFSTWNYQPEYLPKDMAIQVAENTLLREPLVFHLPFARRQDKTPHCNEPMSHSIGWQQLTSISVTVNNSFNPLSDAAKAVDSMHNCSISNGNSHLLELVFDTGKHNASHDFRPLLPLICRW